MRIPKKKIALNPDPSIADAEQIAESRNVIRDVIKKWPGVEATQRLLDQGGDVVGPPPRLTLDALVFRVRDKLGCGFGVTVCAPNPNKAHADSQVCVSWHRLSAMRDKDGGKRVAFARDLTAALEYVLEYERRYDAEGADAAASWHRAETKRRELDTERLIEEARRAREGRSS